MYYELLNK